MATLPEFVETADQARLIPVAASSNQEQRTLSVLLAALRGVQELQEVLLGALNQRVGKRAKVDAWTEVALNDGSGKQTKKKDQEKGARPDGLLVLDTGRRRWQALIEAKTGNNELDSNQVAEYMEHAKKLGVDAVITISNQFVAMPSHAPVEVRKTLTKHVDLFHFSWAYLLTQASLLLEEDTVQSADQRFVLEEVVRYLRSDVSGVNRFDSMNREWKDVVAKFQSGDTLRAGDEDVIATVAAWHQEQRDLALLMSRRLGNFTQIKLPRAHRSDPNKRLQDDCKKLVETGELRCTLDIPDAASELAVAASLTRRSITCAMELEAPEDKKSCKARVNWLLRQLKGPEVDGLYLKAIRKSRAKNTQVPLKEALEDPNALDTDSTQVAPTTFQIFYLHDLAGRFARNRVFIDELETAVPHFYAQVGQHLRGWVPPPPKMRQQDPNDEVSDEPSGDDADAS